MPVAVDGNGKITGVALNGPAFSVYQTVAQSVGPGDTLLSLDTKEYDTANAFSTATSRFQPTVPGYYMLNGLAQSAGASVVNFYTTIYKNGVVAKYGTFGVMISPVSALVFLNGTTDYAELRAAQNPAANTSPGQNRVVFQGFLARVA